MAENNHKALKTQYTIIITLMAIGVFFGLFFLIGASWIGVISYLAGVWVFLILVSMAHKFGWYQSGWHGAIGFDITKTYYQSAFWIVIIDITLYALLVVMGDYMGLIGVAFHFWVLFVMRSMATLVEWA